MKVVILCGTRGLGSNLAIEAARRGITPLVLGRGIREFDALRDPGDPPYETCRLDLADSGSIMSAIPGCVGADFLVWIAGPFLKKRHRDVSDGEIQEMTAVHLTGPWSFLRAFLAQQRRPIHLITIASSSSWKLREKEAIYCAFKAAQATFIRNLVPELLEELPGSKVTLVNPGGLQVPSLESAPWRHSGTMLDPAKVAAEIWNVALGQQMPFIEVQMLRDQSSVDPSTPVIRFGAEAPQSYREPFAVASGRGM